MPATPATTIAISLVSHTNAGKTTLARTLLQRDIGEVRDAPHVTEFAEDHRLLRTEAGDELRLWDTPGFGDSVRLVRRLRSQGNPLGWFMSEVWDRWRDRAFWASQVAMRHVRERSDVVLYLVNAAESPEAAAYVEPEMDLLAWVGKPVIVLLNQMGMPRPGADEAQDLERWKRHLSGRPVVRSVMAMDAFARCWVQEGALLQAVQGALPLPQQAAMDRLRAEWLAQRRATFDRAMEALAQSLGRIAGARFAVEGAVALGQVTRRIGAVFGAKPASADPVTRAQQALVDALDADVRACTDTLIALHGLDGRARDEILARVSTQFTVQDRVDEGGAAVVGGMISGALTGLAADVASMGLTLGGGLLAGGILGALGAAGLARGVNLMRGGGPPWVGWSTEALGPLVEASLLRYLAVAHFGRGRGLWAQGEAPAHWREVVAEALKPHEAALAALWKGRSTRLDAEGEAERLAAAVQPLVHAAAQTALQRLYPGSLPVGAESTP